MEEAKYYLGVYTRLKNKGVYGVSLVGKPAMEGKPVFLKEQEKPIQFKTVDEEQRIILGMIMKPNFNVYRFDEETQQPYYISFTADTIKEMAYDFIANGHQNNSSLEHETKIDGVSIVETWIKTDAVHDKSVAFGIDEAVGCWFGMMRISNDKIWDDYIKTGLIGGFSIDAVIELEEVNLKSNINMSKEVLEETQKQTTILDGIKEAISLAFGSKKVEEVKLGSVKTKDGEITIEYDGEELVVGTSAWVMADAETKVPVPVGEHALEDGKTIVVTEEGIVGEVKDAVAEEAPTEAPQAEGMNAETTAPATDADQAMEDVANAIKSILVKYSETETIVKDIKTQLSEVLKENAELKVALNAQPAKKPIKSQPAQSGEKLTLAQRLNAKL